MLVVSGIACLLVGLVALVGQSISCADFGLAQKLGLQEKDAETEPLFRRLELNTARWDVIVLWILPAAGVLMLVDHGLWPHLSVIAGGVWLDAGGREVAKLLGLRKQGVRVGALKEVRLALGFLGLMSVLGTWCIAHGLVALI